MIPPKGFKAELYPLRHNFFYSFGLSMETETINSTIATLVKNYDGVQDPQSIKTNPHHPSFETETGAICSPMSIIDKLTLSMKFNITRQAIAGDVMTRVKVEWTPIFASFPEKLDAADEKSTTTVKALLGLTTDATEEDITPAFAVKLSTDGDTDLAHPVSTANFTEVFGTLNLTTNTTMEGVPFNKDTFLKALRYYTNKGALKACIGRTRHVTIFSHGNNSTKSFQIKKFVPRAVRRIVPYSFFGILFHCPIETDYGSDYHTTALTASKAQVGVKVHVAYHEWNAEHDQTNA